ncbi:MAG: ABC transporter ATP-binding protein [Rhodospirillales bacterium]|nr:ABC transporter ATP-binding protein [Rhodospirillales bacterium]
MSTAYLMRRLWRESIQGKLTRIYLAVVLMMITAGATAVTAYIFKDVVDEVFIAKDQIMLWRVAGIVLVAYFVKGAANYGQSLVMNHVGLRIIADAQNRLFRHLAALDLAFFQHTPSGTLISRFTVDVHQMKVAVSNGITALGKDLTTLVGLVTVMFIQDWRLALASFFVFPVAIYPIVRIGKRMRKVTANTQEEIGFFTTVLNQTFQGIRVVKAYGMAAYEETRIAEVVERIFKLNFKAVRSRELARPIMETLGGLAVTVIIVYGGSRVIAGETTAGAFFSFNAAFLMAYDPMKRLANLNVSIQEGLASAQRLFSVMDRASEIIDKPSAKPLPATQGHIRFTDVYFSYNADVHALRGLNIEVASGQTVALVGPSGGGKSTILNLIPRFYDVTSGAVSIDGHDVRDVTLASLYANIALVSQEVTLFDDTVAANIAYGRLGASQDDIEEAARNAAADAFIRELPSGYQTMVGERGLRLSGGQRQRLAIARAMLKNAPILLLDEATSALDTESERYVQAALTKLMQGRTTLVIAHRLSTVVDADMICVVEGGCIIERGTHVELLAKGGTYKRLYDLQFAESELVDQAPTAEAG